MLVGMPAGVLVLKCFADEVNRQLSRFACRGCKRYLASGCATSTQCTAYCLPKTRAVKTIHASNLHSNVRTQLLHALARKGPFGHLIAVMNTCFGRSTVYL